MLSRTAPRAGSAGAALARRVGRAPARGFTLIEVLIAIVVVAVLAGIAWPSFADAVRRGRRIEAIAALGGVQLAQEQWRGQARSYSVDLSALRIAERTVSGAYRLSLSAPADTEGGLALGYVATAVAAEGSTQAGDRACRRMSVRVLAGTPAYAGCADCATFDYLPVHPCWTR